MQIDRVSYGELRSTGNFSNRKIEVEAALAEGECPRESLRSLVDFVREEFGLWETVKNLEGRKQSLEQDITDLAYEVETNRACVAQLREIIAKLKNEREELRCAWCGETIPAGKLIYTENGSYCSEECRDSCENKTPGDDPFGDI